MAARTDLGELLLDRNFMTYTAGVISNQLGYWMLRTETGWLAWEQTRSSTWVGLVVFADMMPALLVGPGAGVLADRTNLRTLLLTTQLCTVAVLAILSGLAMAGQLHIPLLIALIFCNGVIVGLAQPAGQVALTALVETRHLPTAISAHSILFNVGRFVGPALAGGLIASFGAGPALLVTGIMMAGLLVAILAVRFRPIQRAIARGPIIRQSLDGLVYLRSQPAAWTIFLLFLCGTVTLRPIAELLPGIADRISDGGGPTTLAWMSSAMGVGAIGAGALNMFGGISRLASLAYWGALLAIVAGLGMAFSNGLVVALLASAVFGGAIAAGGVSAQTTLQVASPPHFRGRVSSLFGMAFRAGPAAGALLMGALADRIGLTPAILIGTGAMFALWVYLVPRWSSMGSVASQS